MNCFKQFDGNEKASKTLETPVAPRDEVYALTTIKNFRGDTLDEYVFESDWVFVTREKLLEPRFQQRLAKSDALTALCKVLSRRNANIIRTEMIARPPCCHCQDLCHENRSKSKSSVFRRFCNTMLRLWRRVCDKFKNSKSHRTKNKLSATTSNKEADPLNNYTINYLCR